jgi:tRNA (guanine37-N1)-methyltransferase
MVMLPEIWGKALDSLMTPETDLIILTPAGKRFDQPMAGQFSQAKHLVFACGRYEGIDDRVRQHYESKNYRVHEVSIGDYVLGGGEVASLVMIEAITRLIPGVLGNPESLAEESHNEEGYLEYPNFTKPSTWRDIEVPAILLSGNHGEIAKWRKMQATERAKKNL